MACENLVEGVAYIRQLSGQHFEQHDAEAVKIAASVRVAVVDLLRTHIVRGAGAQIRPRHVDGLDLGACRSEVDQDHAIVVGQHQIRRLEISVHHVGGVQNLQRLADLARIVQRIGLADGILQSVAQAAAGKIFQGQIQVVVRNHVVQHIGDRAVIQLGQNFAFAHEALTIVLGNHEFPLDRLHLERHRLCQFIVAGQIHGGRVGLRYGLHQPVAGDLGLAPGIGDRRARGL